MKYSIKQQINIENKIGELDVNDIVFELLLTHQKNNEVVQLLLNLSENDRKLIIEEIKSDFKLHIKELFKDQFSVYPKDFFKLSLLENDFNDFPLIKENIQKINDLNENKSKKEQTPVFIETDIGEEYVKGNNKEDGEETFIKVENYKENELNDIEYITAIGYVKSKDYVKDIDEVCRIEREMFDTVGSISKSKNSVTINGSLEGFGDRMVSVIKQGIKLRLKEEYSIHFDKNFLKRKVKNILIKMIEPELGIDSTKEKTIEDEKFKIGAKVEHEKYGKGVVIEDKNGLCHQEKEVMVKFDEGLPYLKISAISGYAVDHKNEETMYETKDIMEKSKLKLIEEPKQSKGLGM